MRRSAPADVLNEARAALADIGEARRALHQSEEGSGGAASFRPPACGKPCRDGSRADEPVIPERRAVASWPVSGASRASPIHRASAVLAMASLLSRCRPEVVDHLHDEFHHRANDLDMLGSSPPWFSRSSCWGHHRMFSIDGTIALDQAKRAVRGSTLPAARGRRANRIVGRSHHASTSSIGFQQAGARELCRAHDHRSTCAARAQELAVLLPHHEGRRCCRRS